MATDLAVVQKMAKLAAAWSEPPVTTSSSASASAPASASASASAALIDDSSRLQFPDLKLLSKMSRIDDELKVGLAARLV